MSVNETPTLDKNNSETGCCPRFKPDEWDEKTFEFENKLFVKTQTRNFMHVPLNMGSMMRKTWAKIREAGADSYGFLMLSYDPSPWKGEHYLSVTRQVPELENVQLSGAYLAKVFEGPYREAGTWAKNMAKYVTSKGKDLKKMYFYYTTCPKCAKQYGENYVVGFAQI